MSLRLDEVLEKIKGKVVCTIDEERKEFESGEKALAVYGGRKQYEEYYVVEAIYAKDGVVMLDVKDIRPEINETVEKFEKEHYERYGVYFNPFDGA